MIHIQAIELPSPGIELLRAEAQSEGYDFVETLVEEWAAGVNRFEGPGEALFGHLDNGRLVAIGGLNCDPFAGRPDIGRIRRVYVRAAWRNKGIGRALVTALIQRARAHFRLVRLRAENARAAALYERIGFHPIEDPDATHVLDVSVVTTVPDSSEA
jgi:GNAT superfamily N-acetyltransferase